MRTFQRNPASNAEASSSASNTINETPVPNQGLSQQATESPAGPRPRMAQCTDKVQKIPFSLMWNVGKRSLNLVGQQLQGYTVSVVAEKLESLIDGLLKRERSVQSVQPVQPVQPVQYAQPVQPVQPVQKQGKSEIVFTVVSENKGGFNNSTTISASFTFNNATILILLFFLKLITLFKFKFKQDD